MRGSPINIIPSLHINNNHITDRPKIANELANYYLYKSQSTIPIHLPPLDATVFNTDLTLHYNSIFSMQELLEALRRSKRTSPGPDKIPLEMLQHLPPTMLDTLLRIYNHIWLHATFPLSWLQSIIIPIHKPGKPRSSPNSYRPISLTNHLCKVLERMVLQRLTWTLETNNFLLPFQYGFRKAHSSMDHLASLDTDIRRSFHHKNHLVLASLDLSSAFDMTNRTIILTQLKTFGLQGSLPKFISNFLQPRSLQVKANGLLSSPYSTSLGVPQGSVLSPTLFNLAIASISSYITPNIKTKIFADDIILYSSSSSSRECTTHLQQALLSLCDWANHYGFSFSPSKSTILHFCKHTLCPRLNPLLLSNNPIPMADSLKILGLTFDNRLTWKTHIKTLKSRTSTDLNLLRLLSNMTWGADFPSLLQIYKSLILSKLAYGDFIYDSASPSTTKALETIQNQALRFSTGTFRTTPIPSLQCLTSIPPLYLTRQLSLMKFYSTSLHRPHSRCSLNLFNVHLSNQSFPVKSIPHRISSLLSLHNFTPPKFNYPLQTTFPPWLSSSPPIDLSMLPYNKFVHSRNFLNKQFLSILSTKYQSHHHIYTDGSKTGKGVGAAFTTNSINRMFKLPPYASIFTAELLAIKEAMRFAITIQTYKNILIVSDSLSALSSIKSRNLSYNYIRQILDLCYMAKLKHKSFSFLWSPSHVGVRGNDRADFYAKLAIVRGIPNLDENHFSDFNSLLCSTFDSLFQLQWDLENPTNKLWPLKPNVFPPLHLSNQTRRENVIMRRLAAGHTYNTHSYLLKNEQAPLCSTCGSSLTVAHIFESRHLQHIRNTHNIPSNLLSVIKNFAEIKSNLITYLREIDFQV